MSPWRDRAGRLSPLKSVAFLLVLAPGLWLAVEWAVIGLGARPFTTALRETGQWAIRLLFLSLAIAPFRRIFNWSDLIAVRRMIGVAALGYAIAHIGLYTLDQNLDVAKVLGEIWARFYLTIGAVAAVGLLALGITSTDGMIRRLTGRRWQMLHRAAYGIALLAVAHFFLQSRSNVWQPTLMAGLLIWLLSWRLWLRRAGMAGMGLRLGALGLGATLATALAEFGWYAGMTGIPALAVFAANIDPAAGLRPAWAVAGAGLTVSAGAEILALARTARTG